MKQAAPYDDDYDHVDDEPETYEEEPASHRPEDIGDDQDASDNGADLHTSKKTCKHCVSEVRLTRGSSTRTMCVCVCVCACMCVCVYVCVCACVCWSRKRY